MAKAKKASSLGVEQTTYRFATTDAGPVVHRAMDAAQTHFLYPTFSSFSVLGKRGAVTVWK